MRIELECRPTFDPGPNPYKTAISGFCNNEGNQKQMKEILPGGGERKHSGEMKRVNYFYISIEHNTGAWFNAVSY